MSPCDIPGEHRAAKAIRRIIRPCNRLLLILKARYHDEGPEDLFAINLHVVLNIREHGRLDKEALAINILICLSSQRQSRAFTFPALNIAEHFLKLRARDLRALEGVVGEWIPDFTHALHLLLKQFHEALIHALLHQDPACGGAYLAHVTHDADMAPLHRLLQIRVFEDQERRFPARFERDVFHVYGCGFHDLFSGRGAACEGDLVDVEVRSEGGAGDVADSVEDVDYAGGKTGFGD